MSRYKQFEVARLKDYSLQSRPSKIRIADFAKPLKQNSIFHFAESLPDILAARELRDLAGRIRLARARRRAIIWGFGGHVIKVGLAPILIDLLERGFVTALATNGSGMIHDFEIGWAGHTSEDVDQALKGGNFGMARETAELISQAIRSGSGQNQGIGEAVGEFLDQSKLQYPDFSLLLQAYRKNFPVTVHVAIGTDTFHNHPAVSGEALGKGSQIDFRIFTHQILQLHDGGVYLNLGSAVILPEVFIKAVSLIRNSGKKLENFTTANLDFIQHYRPLQNVVRRPVQGSGKGIALTGHHEIMVPLLAGLLLYG